MAASRTLPLFPSLPIPQRRRAPVAALQVAPPPRPPGSEPRAREPVAQLWLAISFPRLALDALQGGDADAGAAHESLAILDLEDRQQRVLACSELARQRGVRAGQPLNAALAFDSTLRTLPRDAYREQRLLEALAVRCQRFTPVVSVAGADELLLEVRGSLHLFGGAPALMKRLDVELAGHGVMAGMALTPTARSALWLARRDAEARPCIQRAAELSSQLSTLPLGSLRWPAEVVERLVNMGVRNVGDLLRLPRAGLARRIGPQWLEELDRAQGRSVEVRRRFEPRERYDDTEALECEIETVAGLKAALEPILGRLQRFLRLRGAALGSLVLELGHRSHPASRLRIGLAAPSTDVGHLRGLLHERLGSVSLSAPVRTIRLRSGATAAAQPASVRLPYAQGQVLVGQPSMAVLPDALPRLVERLQARLGREALFGLGVVADHRPELAWRALQPLREQQPVAGALHGPRPLWLMAEPRPVQPRNWQIESGPERIESGWWDGGDVVRDYFIARDPRGARCWIFRERSAPQRWFVHGLFG